MKKIFSGFLMTILFLSAQLTLSAQDFQAGKIIKLNLPGLAVGAGSVSFESVLNDQHSIVISPTFGFYNFDALKFTILGAGIEYRSYLSHNRQAPAGLYVAPGATLLVGRANAGNINNGNDYVFMVYGGSVKGVFGYQWVWQSGLVVDINIGLQYLHLFASDNKGGYWKGGGATLPAFGLAVGYGF